MSSEYRALYIQSDSFEDPEELEKWVRDICDPLKRNFTEITSPSINEEKESIYVNPELPFDSRTRKLLEKVSEGEASREILDNEVTEYVSEGEVYAREYFLDEGRLFLSRDGCVEEICERNDIEYQTIEEI